MLEIRNVTKVYRSKTGEEVRALDNVSVTFPEAGMVFILGKSGSGKSTLLNIMGGLDSYDSGEFIIKGKSSKDFVGSDFDAYRNTFIGFIFQEYNVLDDFTVGANIGLALELQGKKATDEAINSILAQVDLLNYAKRQRAFRRSKATRCHCACAGEGTRDHHGRRAHGRTGFQHG